MSALSTAFVIPAVKKRLPASPGTDISSLLYQSKGVIYPFHGCHIRLSVIDLCPRNPTIGGFVNAVAGIVQIEGVCEHSVRGDGALVKIIRAFEIAPASNTRQSDWIPGYAAVEGIIGLNTIAWRNDDVFRRAGGNRPSIGLTGECAARLQSFVQVWPPLVE